MNQKTSSKKNPKFQAVKPIKANINERTFSIELTSKNSLKSITFGDDSKGVLIEGSLGDIQELNLLEELILEVSGARGTLRLDMRREELESALNYKGNK